MGLGFVLGKLDTIGFTPLCNEAFEDKVWGKGSVCEGLLRLRAGFVPGIKPLLDAGPLVRLKRIPWPLSKSQ